MLTAMAPATVRDQAYAVIRAASPDRERLQNAPLLAAGAAVVADLLLALERAFAIDLDADELWSQATAEDLAALVERKVASKARRALIAANDHDAARAPRAPIPLRPMPLHTVPRPDKVKVQPVYLPPAGQVERRMAWTRLLWRGALICWAAGSVAALAYGVAVRFGGSH